MCRCACRCRRRSGRAPSTRRNRRPRKATSHAQRSDIDIARGPKPRAIRFKNQNQTKNTGKRMTKTGADGAGNSRLRVVLAASIGSALECYYFFLYGTAAALVFGELFFPKNDPVVGTLLAFLTFGVGFVFRPLGGIIFGVLGDRYGRKPVL